MYRSPDDSYQFSEDTVFNSCENLKSTVFKDFQTDAWSWDRRKHQGSIYSIHLLPKKIIQFMRSQLKTKK
jgi:hypothetical protein